MLLDASSVSEMSEEVLEVTREDHLRRIGRKTTSSSSSSPRRLRLFKGNKKESASTADNVSVSLSYTTGVSHETVKASNTTTKKPTRWKKIKQILRSGGQPKTAPLIRSSSTTSSSSHEPPLRKRAHTDPKHQQQLVVTTRLDDCIRGCLDGLDLVGLGGVVAATAPFCPSSLVTGRPHESSISQQVYETLNRHRTMVLEGFCPGMDDRWSVRLGKEEVPSLWGKASKPTSLSELERYAAEDDPVLLLAAECSVPIDVDDDSFIVSNREHLCAIYEICAGPLAKGDWSTALSVMDKLEKGLDSTEYPFLRGTVCHNMGVVMLWKGDYEGALAKFGKAVQERTEHLPKNHPDLIVSLVRQAMAYFALNKLCDAARILKKTLAIIPTEHMSKAKVRNNLGVIYFHKKDYDAALSEFTKSLAIQKEWLDENVKRDALIFDTAATLTNIGHVHVRQGAYEKACSVYEEALLLRTTICRKENEIVLSSLTNLALAKAHAGDLKKSLRLLNGCLRVKNARYGSGSAATLDTLGFIGCVYMQRGQLGDANTSFAPIKNWHQDHTSPTHVGYMKLKELMDKITNEFEKDSSSLWV